VERFHQEVVLDRGDVVVTLARNMELDPPLRVEDDVILESGSSVVWFTFPGAWHDIGRFHRADGTFAGLYANVLTPVEMAHDTWHTTDLFLDLWLPRGGAPRILDGDELDEAESRGHVTAETAERAREEARRLRRAAREGRWPPEVVEAWTLERVLGASAPQEG
jgi:predicted RNA-binding protein associated with RNAse of E/G family